MKLNQKNIKQSLDGLKNSEFSAKDLVESCFDQIKALDPSINAFLTLDKATALKEASKVDKIINADKKVFEKYPLLGIPFAVKDNYLTKGLRTTASSKVLDDYIPQYNSTVIDRIKGAGAIIIGKTNMDAWAHGSSTETSDYGATSNPRDISRIPGGSSGGSAAAIASDMAIAALGSETAGSIRQPAAWCGLVGLKPTYGRVSRYGVIAMGSSLDSPGPMTKTVWDSALTLSVIAGKDEHDATTSSEPVSKYHENLAIDLNGMKIGVPKEYFMDDAQEGINDLVMSQIKSLEKFGAKLIEISVIDPKYSIADYTIIQRAEVFSNLARYDGIRYGNDRTFFGQEAKRRSILGAYALKVGERGEFYKLGQKVRTLLKEDFDRVFNQVDAIAAPTVPSIAPLSGASEDQAMFGELVDLLQEPSSMAGMSGISVPCGTLEGLPVGMQIIGPQYQEQTILDIAHVYESNTDWSKNAK